MMDLDKTTRPSSRSLRRHDGSCRFESHFHSLMTEVSCHCIALSRPTELACRLHGYLS
jgi:hypothetical protein